MRCALSSPATTAPMPLPETLAILMVVAVCGLLLVGYPVALILGGGAAWHWQSEIIGIGTRWYLARVAAREDAAGVRRSIAEVEALIARERDRGLPPGRVLLAGFSQGGAITLATGLRREQALLGLVALSTYLPLAAETPAEATPQGLATPLFMAHGTQDPVVPLAAGQKSVEALKALGMEATLRRYPMPHSVCAEEIRDLGDWMEARFASA